MNLAEQHIAAMARPERKPIPRVVVGMVERTAGMKARAAVQTLDALYGALMLLKADIRDEATAHQIEALIPSLQEIARRYPAAPVKHEGLPGFTARGNGRFEPDDFGRGSE